MKGKHETVIPGGTATNLWPPYPLISDTLQHNLKSNTMKRLLIILIGLMVLLPLMGQNQSDPVIIEKGLGTKFKQNGKLLTPGDLLTVTMNNEEAHTAMKTAKTNYDVSFVFGFAGGFLVGWPIGTSLGGGDPNWTMAAIGGGLIAISIPFSIGYNKNAKKAVNIYNKGLEQGNATNINLEFGMTRNGVGVKVRF